MKYSEAKTLIMKIKAHECQFSSSDIELMNWLNTTSDASFASVFETFKGALGNDLVTMRWEEAFWHSARWKGSKRARRIGSVLIVHEIRENSGHSFSFSDMPSYAETVKKVQKRLAKTHKKKYPELSTVEARESEITDWLVDSTLKKLTPEQLQELLKDSDLTEAEIKKAAMALAAQGGAGFTLVMLAKVFGKKAIKEAVLAAVEKAIVWKAAQAAGKRFAAEAAKKIPQKAFSRMSNYIGVALLLKDAFDLFGEATRITTPAVVRIAVHRTMERENLAAGIETKDPA